MRLWDRYILIFNTVSKKTVLFTFLLVAFVPTAFSQQARFQTIQYRWYTDEEPCDRVYKSPTDRIRAVRDGLAHRVGIIEGESRTCVPRNSPGYNSIYGSTGTFVGTDGTGNATLVGDPTGGYALLVNRHTLVDEDGVMKSPKFMYFPDPTKTTPRIELSVDQDQLVKEGLIGAGFGRPTKKVRVEDDWALIPLPNPIPWVGAPSNFKPKPFKMAIQSKEKLLASKDASVFYVGHAKPKGAPSACLSRQGPYSPFRLSKNDILKLSIQLGTPEDYLDGETVGTTADGMSGYSGTPIFKFEDNQIQLIGIHHGGDDYDIESKTLGGIRRFSAATLTSRKIVDAYKRAMRISAN